MTSTVPADVRGVEEEFALIVARMDPFSEPDFEPLEDDDEAAEEEEPAIDWP